MEGFHIGRGSLGRQVNMKTWRIGWADFNQCRVWYDHSIKSHIPQFAEPLTSPLFISLMGHHVRRNVDIYSTGMSVLNPFAKLIHGEVSGTATQTIGLSTNEDSICSVINGNF